MSRSGMQSQHAFSMVPRAQIPRSSFNRSFTHKTTFNASALIPVFVDEVLPGDTFNLRMTAFVRMATPIFPLMDNLYLDSFFFFVPNRLLWVNWEKFNGAQDNPGDSTDYTVPEVGPVTTAPGHGSLFDYFGIPAYVNGAGEGYFVNALHFRAYRFCYNEWFKDQNLVFSPLHNTDDGPDAPSIYPILTRGKRHDYFTSALPFPQKGDAVTMPIGGFANIVTGGHSGIISDGNPFALAGTGGYNTALDAAGSATPSGTVLGSAFMAPSTDPGSAVKAGLTYFGDGGGLMLDLVHTQADLSSATAATINAIRQAFQIQKLLERDARGGTRYTEILRSHFGVVSPDFRLQRPEYLGGGTTMVNVHPVVQTSATGASGTTTPLGNVSAFGTALVKGHGFVKSFTEHGVLLGLINVRADLTYQRSLNRMWTRQTRYDFYWPAFAMLGEQVVLNQEIYFQGGISADTEAFAYQERYAEYRYKPSLITGQFNSYNSTPLDSWHLAQKFTSLPTLGSAFIEEAVPMSRVLADTTDDNFIGDFFFQLNTARPMPVFGVPGMIDHF